MSAVVVGSGPNGLAAAVTLARAGVPVTVLEASDHYGGALRSTTFGDTSATIDLGSAIHPFVGASPFFTGWAAMERLSYVTPEISYAHPLEDGQAAIAYRDIRRTIDELGPHGRAWQRTFARATENVGSVATTATRPVLRSILDPRGPLALTPGIAHAMLGDLRGRNGLADALFSGLAAHSGAPSGGLSSASVGVVLGALAHSTGWPLPAGGAQRLADALVEDLTAHGGILHLGQPIEQWEDIPPADIVLLATSGIDARRILASRAGHPARPPRTLPQGPGVFKVDLLLSEPIPWANPQVRLAPTVHLGGSAQEVRHSEHEVASGRVPANPFVMLTQPTVVDPERGQGYHTAWAYTRVPPGCPVDMTEAILTQIEAVAPDARQTIVGITVTPPGALQALNRSLVGGDILGGTTRGLDFARRPTFHPAPWRTRFRSVYHCSSAVAPGPGVHGMPGYLAALDALRTHYNLPAPNLRPTSTI
ncbi:phytoene desaturase family protein [Leifsonia sp. McL0607]|uniref:phytoene desaturase family protein n=1 Tax=Leifsonia sp. McL0607 TaxID=3415672 RepID=UPI003CF27743